MLMETFTHSEDCATSPWIRIRFGFLRGMGSVLDVCGESSGDCDTQTPWWLRDRDAIRHDWERVGELFQNALRASGVPRE